MSDKIIAVLLAILAYTMLNVGFILERKGAKALPRVENQGFFRNILNFVTNVPWFIGYFLTSVQYYIYLAAIRYGSISLVTPFSGLGIVVLVVLSSRLLGEKISRKEIVAIALIVAGVIGLGITSPDSSTDRSPERVAASLGSPGPIAFIAVLVAAMVAPVLLSSRGSRRNSGISFAVAAGVASCITAIFSYVLAGYISTENLVPGLLAAFKALPFWLLILAVNLSGTAGTAFLQVGYQRGKASLVAPLFTIVSTVGAVIVGIVLFGEWRGFSPVAGAVRMASIAVVTVGAAILSRANAKITAAEGDHS
jgi:drug/metabolite transporter (DMT)-like permease